MIRNGTAKREAGENMADYDGRPCVAAMDLGTNSNPAADCGYGGGMPCIATLSTWRSARGWRKAANSARRATERAICSFMDFAEMMKLYNVRRYRAIATAACG